MKSKAAYTVGIAVRAVVDTKCSAER